MIMKYTSSSQKIHVGKKFKDNNVLKRLENPFGTKRIKKSPAKIR